MNNTLQEMYDLYARAKGIETQIILWAEIVKLQNK